MNVCKRVSSFRFYRKTVVENHPTFKTSRTLIRTINFTFLPMEICTHFYHVFFRATYFIFFVLYCVSVWFGLFWFWIPHVSAECQSKMMISTNTPKIIEKKKKSNPYKCVNMLTTSTDEHI
jgi:hypothetical protein